MLKTVLPLFMTLLLPFFGTSLSAESASVRENFDSIAQWQPLSFAKIERRSTYETYSSGEGETFLRAKSKNSASGLVWKHEFKVRDFPRLRWRWRVSNVYKAGNAETKEGDDCPARVFVMFAGGTKQDSVWRRFRNSALEMLYGESPPHSVLSYVWANRPHEKKIFASPYTDSVRTIVVREGSKELGRWLVEEVSILEDYRRAFAEEPPEKARIAIMNDSDNTGEHSISYFDYIEVLAPE